MTYKDFLVAIANGEQFDGWRTNFYPQIDFPVCEGLPEGDEFAFRMMGAAVRRDANQFGRLLEEVAGDDEYQPEPVTPRRPDRDEEFAHCRELAVGVHTDGAISLRAAFASLEALEVAPLAGTYGLLLLVLAAASGRHARRLVISLGEAIVMDENLPLAPPPPFVPVSIGPIGHGVEGILAMEWSDVRFRGSEAA